MFCRHSSTNSPCFRVNNAFSSRYKEIDAQVGGGYRHQAEVTRSISAGPSMLHVFCRFFSSKSHHLPVSSIFSNRENELKTAIGCWWRKLKEVSWPIERPTLVPSSCPVDLLRPAVAVSYLIALRSSRGNGPEAETGGKVASSSISTSTERWADTGLCCVP